MSGRPGVDGSLWGRQPVTGVWIALEGADGCGKSTQAQRLALEYSALLTREPGGSPTGLAIRSVVLHADLAMSPRTEALLMAADRAQHVDEVVGPALDEGRVVVSDRSAGSSLAYQGVGRGLGVEAIRQINDWALAGRWPDVFVLLDCPVDQAVGRIGRHKDRIEQASPEFFEDVAAGFRALAAADPDRWIVVDATGTEDEVTTRILSQLRAGGHLPTR